MRGRSAWMVSVVLSAAVFVALPAAHAAVKPGATCKAKEAGKTVRVGTKDLRCGKKGKAYVWSVVTAKSSAGQKPPSGKAGSGQGGGGGDGTGGGKAGSGQGGGGGGSGQGGGGSSSSGQSAGGSTGGSGKGSGGSSSSGQGGSSSSTGQADISQGIASSSLIPKVIQNWSLELAPYDAATGKAGVMKLAGVQPPTFSNPDDTDAYKRIVGVYGMQVHGILEPQMAFIAPLGTKVISMVDGTVCDLTALYSKDVSIRVAPKGVACSHGAAPILFEHEHVISPTVKVGDTVTAGQHIATVSDYSSPWAAKGMGLVEIGVFFSKNDNSGRPWHACLSNFLAPAKSASLLQTLTSIQQAWATVRGDASLDTVAKQNPVGCLTQDDITDSNNAQTGAKG